MQESQSQHVKQIRIDQRLVVDLFNGMAKRQCFYLPKMEGLPEGTVVLNVSNCWDRRCLLALVEHPSFPDVPFGMAAPIDEEIWVDAIERKDLAQECCKEELLAAWGKIDHRDGLIESAITALGTHYNHRETLANTIERLVAMVGAPAPQPTVLNNPVLDECIAALGAHALPNEPPAMAIHRVVTMLDYLLVQATMSHVEWKADENKDIIDDIKRIQQHPSYGMGMPRPSDDRGLLVLRSDATSEQIASLYQSMIKEDCPLPDEIVPPSDVCPDCKGRKVYIGFTTEETCRACKGSGKVQA